MDNLFTHKAEDSEAAVTVDFSAASDSLLMAFGGVAGKIGMPPFEFFNITRELPALKMYVRDLHQAWYQKGLAGLTTDIESTAAFLKEKILESGARRTVLVGNSMGGWAAIVFGILLGADIVNVFAPQTYINRGNRWRHLEFRWWRVIGKAQRIADKRYLDIRKMLQSSEMPGRIHIYYSAADRIDRIHAERLGSFPCVELHPMLEAGHGIVGHLRETGELKEILLRSLTGRPDNVTIKSS